MLRYLDIGEGYSEEKIEPYPLNEVPSHVKNIGIAFIQPIKDSASTSPLATTWAFDDQFVYKEEQIKQWIQEINERGTDQRVMLSILDTPTCHWYPDVDIDEFAKNISASCDEMGIAGIDVDAESGMPDPDTHYVQTFVCLIKALKKYLSPDKVISYTCYTESDFDSKIIGQCKEDIDWINTMAYWLPVEQQIALFNHYSNDIGDPNKVGIGMKAGDGGDASTLDTVTQCAQFIRDEEEIKEKRMMLWSLTRDIHQITNQKDCAYLNCILQNIVPSIQAEWDWIIIEKADYDPLFK